MSTNVVQWLGTRKSSLATMSGLGMLYFGADNGMMPPGLGDFEGRFQYDACPIRSNQWMSQTHCQQNQVVW